MEGGDAATHAEVLPDEDGHPFVVGFKVAQIAFDSLDFAQKWEPEALFGSKKCAFGLNQWGQIRIKDFAAEPAGQQGAAGRLVMAADADGAEEGQVAGIANDILADASPEEIEGLEAALVFDPDEGPSELEGRAETLPKSRFKLEQSPGVEIAVRGIGATKAVGATDPALLAIPEDEVGIV